MNAESLRLWNRAIGLSRPTVGELRAAVRPPIFEVVNPNFPYAFNLNERCTARVPLRSSAADDAAVLSIKISLEGLIAGVVHLLGIAMPCDAEHALSLLRAKDPTPLTLSSELAKWTITYGDALVVTFKSIEPVGTDPAESSTIAVEYFYSIRYTGRQLPVLLSSTG